MIRWHSRSDAYDLTPQTATTRQSDTTSVGFILPVWSSAHENSNEYTQVGTRESYETGSVHANRFLIIEDVYRKTARATHNHVVAPLPLVYQDGVPFGMQQNSALTEGALTGCVNATTGAVLAGGAMLLLGPVGLVASAAVAGAAALGVTTGVAQTVSVNSSNAHRIFVDHCNELLLYMREAGLDDTAREMLRMLRMDAQGDAKIAFLNSVITLCCAHFNITPQQLLAS